MNDELTTWKEQTSKRSQLAREAMADAGEANDWDHAKAVTESMRQVSAALEHLMQARKEWQQSLAAFDQLTKEHTKARQTRLRITIHWKLAGRDRSDEFIDEPKAADSLARYIGSLTEVLGSEILPSIMRIPNGGSGLVSRNPQTDFVNPSTGDIYGYRSINHTGWHVKTHSSTQDKAEQVREIAARLNLPGQSVVVEVVEK